MNQSLNTKLSLMYRDASNYKASLVVVVNGAITEQQIEQIQSGMDGGEFIIAHQVGLPTPSFQFRERDGWPSDDLDHVWTALPDFEEGVSAPELHTAEPATVSATIEQLANAIANASWDEAAEWGRMQTEA